ncbi:MAG: metallophosphoesterase, partial [Clostridia bacterium]|nr:metallophosphoesterase [Clostridia bacterium]
MEKVKQNLSTIVIFALAICLVFAFAFTMNSAVVYADDTLEGEKVADIKIGQMSDIHYFPLEYCYQNIAAENFYSSDYYNSLTGDTKLVAESGAILTANIKRIIEDAKVGKAPLYMFISGDNTKNGERVAEIDVANGLRYMQNKIRSFGVVNGIDYANFQVFATVGNHDLYNGDGALYDKATGDILDKEDVARHN